MTNIELYEENDMWYVKYTHDGVENVSEALDSEEDAITFSLNLKFIDL
jgi:hypothetical protein